MDLWEHLTTVCKLNSGVILRRMAYIVGDDIKYRRVFNTRIKKLKLLSTLLTLLPSPITHREVEHYAC
jgi:hypothetical protein